VYGYRPIPTYIPTEVWIQANTYIHSHRGMDTGQYLHTFPQRYGYRPIPTYIPTEVYRYAVVFTLINFKINKTSLLSL
jgi:hypothetical protein